MQGASTVEIKAEAIRVGMRSLRMSGIQEAVEGVTSVEEVAAHHGGGLKPTSTTATCDDLRQPAAAAQGHGRARGLATCTSRRGSPPQLRIDGHLVPLKTEPLTPVDTKQLCYSVLTDTQKLRFEEDNELDLSFGVKGLARFRANIFMQRGAVAGAFRPIPFKIHSFNDLGLPPVVAELCNKPRGLILVTGPTGSGKSTTLAAMIDKINTDGHDHIITIEDPIEFLHEHKNCLVNQREVGSDTQSFKKALKYDPAPGPRRGAHRRDARPRDHRGGADHRRDRPPLLRHAAHQRLRLRPSTASSTSSPRTSSRRSARSSRFVLEGVCRSRCAQARAAAARWRWR